MPWTVQSTTVLSPTEERLYRPIPVPQLTGTVVWALSLSSAGEDTVPRLRNGFMAPFISVDGLTLFGPSEELFRRVVGTMVGVHAIGYGWASQYPALPNKTLLFGVAVAPDRGAVPATATLYRLT